jgi:hypothetical protein
MMGKIILEFDGIEDAEDAQIALDAVKWKIAMWDLDLWLRSQIKHAPDSMSDDTYKAFEDCREKLCEILEDSNLHLD